MLWSTLSVHAHIVRAHMSTTGSTDIKIDNVIVENCCDDQTCKVDLGKNTSFSFTFTPGTHTSEWLSLAEGVEFIIYMF